MLGANGFYVDITETFEADMQRSVSEAVAEVEVRRAVIHEAIGIIRIFYGVSSERAFEVLRWRSQESNVKLRTLAELFVRELASEPLDGEARARVDHLLLTLHERA